MSTSLHFRYSGFAKVVVVALLVGGLLGCGTDDSQTGEELGTSGRVSIPDSMTIVRMLESDERFSTLRAALDSTGLDSILAADGPYTLFAPPNEAFESLPPGTMSTLLAQRQDRLRVILEKLVVRGQRDLSGLSDTLRVGTLGVDSLVIAPRNGKLFVDDVPVLDADVRASNGRIHVVRRVLPPPREDNQ